MILGSAEEAFSQSSDTSNSGISKGASNTNRVFWPGGDTAKNVTETYAKNNGATTLEMTQQGIDLSAQTKNMPCAQEKPLWENASLDFANGAKGEVNIFQVAEKGVNIENH